LYFFGENDPSPFAIGYQTAEFEPEHRQSEHARSLLRDKLGDVPQDVLSIGAMRNRNWITCGWSKL
jgi:hypothetical protein